MTYEMIMREAARLMALGSDEELRIRDLDDLRTDGEIGVFFDGMPGAINRALDEIRRRGLLGGAVHVLGQFPTGEYTFEDLPEMDEITGVRNAAGVLSYRYEAGVLTVSQPIAKGRMILSYVPRVTGCTWQGVKGEVPVDARIASLIPYYVKGDLFSRDEPGAATEARNWFEAGLEQMERIRRSQMRQTSVRDVFGMMRTANE